MSVVELENRVCGDAHGGADDVDDDELLLLRC